MDQFKLVSDFILRGDQPQAVEELEKNIEEGIEHQVLLGVTGSGKTFAMANVIARVNRPSLILVHNKTLAAQLFSEFKQLFPENAVEYFVSYYDYYQPEAYVARSDTYIEKEATINEEIDKMRHSATCSLLTRRDVIVVASVSCIFGIGSPDSYSEMMLGLKVGEDISRSRVLSHLVRMQYARNDQDFHRGTFRVRGDVVEVFPAYEDDRAIRIEFFGDEIEALSMVDPLRGETLGKMDRISIYPGSHYVTPDEAMRRALTGIKAEFAERLEELQKANKLLESQRLEQRTLFDLEMLQEMGYCTGIENYSRHLDGRRPGQPPATLLNYFPEDFLLFVDESHATIPQVGGMYRGDRSRKQTLVDFGFRLPSALDNRPLTFDEFNMFLNQVVYVSATPGDYELEKSNGLVVEQVVRPTGLMEPSIEVRPAGHQVDDLLEEIRARVDRGERVLVTTLTKRMAEDLTQYYQEIGLRVRYMHSEIDTLERTEIIRDLRRGNFDTLVGINLLREGLDIPEVSLVAILDADKEGFLRSDRALIQTCGRASRNVNGAAILYADRITSSMKRAIEEINRRRSKQAAFNEEHDITPESITKSIHDVFATVYEADYVTVDIAAEERAGYVAASDIPKLIDRFKAEMKEAASKLEFEKAAELRDRIRDLEQREILEVF